MQTLTCWPRLIPVLVLAWVMVAPLSSSADDDPAKPEPPIDSEEETRRASGRTGSRQEARQQEAGEPAKLKGGDKQKDKGDEPKLSAKAMSPNPATRARMPRRSSPASPTYAPPRTGWRKKDPGDATRGIQKDVLKDLDKLIEENQPASSSNSNNRAAAARPRSGASRKNSRKTAAARARRADKNKNRPARKAASRSGDAQEQGRQGGKTTRTPRTSRQGKNGKGGSGKDRDSSKIADLDKNTWGHLPEPIRQEIGCHLALRIHGKIQWMSPKQY